MDEMLRKLIKIKKQLKSKKGSSLNTTCKNQWPEREEKTRFSES